MEKALETVNSFQLQRKKILDPENMSFADWAGLTLDFLSFCQPIILQYRGEKFHSSRKGFFDDKMEHFFTLDDFLVHNRANVYQRINWQEVKFPDGINERAPVFRMIRCRWTLGAGVNKEIAITKKAELLICEAKFEFLCRQRFNKDSIYKAVSCNIEMANEKNLTQLFTAEKTTGESLLQEIYRYTQDMIRHETERIAEEKIAQFTQAFQESVIANWLVKK